MDFMVLGDPPTSELQAMDMADPPPGLPFPLHLGGRTGETPRLQTCGAARHGHVTGSDPLGEDTGGIRAEMARPLQRTRAHGAHTHQCSHSHSDSQGLVQGTPELL